MTDQRPQFLPEVGRNQRLTQVLALGDVVREEETGTWYIGDGVTLGGVTGGPPTQAALAAILTGTDTLAPDEADTAPLLATQISDMQDCLRAVCTRLFGMFGEDFIQNDDDTAILAFINRSR